MGKVKEGSKEWERLRKQDAQSEAAGEGRIIPNKKPNFKDD